MSVTLLNLFLIQNEGCYAIDFQSKDLDNYVGSRHMATRLEPFFIH